MKYKAVIFDLDGVICHTDRYHFEAWSQIARELNLRFDAAVNNQLRGVGRMESLRIILRYNNVQLSPQDMLAYTDRKNVIYRALLDNMTPADVDGDVLKTLAELQRHGIKMAIGSSSKNTRYILKKIGLQGYFDAVSDGTNISKPKPGPEVFLKACEYLGELPRSCVVVEDARAGIVAAAAGGMDSAGIGDAAHSELATYRLSRVSDLLQYVL